MKFKITGDDLSTMSSNPMTQSHQTLRRPYERPSYEMFRVDDITEKEEDSNDGTGLLGS